MEKQGLEVTDVGIDYLSFTMKAENPFIDEIKSLFAGEQARAFSKGEIEHKIAPAGYRGFRCGKYFYGTYKETTLFQVSSSEAHKTALEIKARGIELKATRLDFQATYKRTPELSAFAQRLRSRKEEVDRKANRTKRVKRTLIEGGGDGDSLAFGSSRAGRSFITYDKSAEQNFQLDGDFLRDEVRFHNEQARKVWLEVLRAKCVETLSVALLQAYLRTQGIDRSYSITAPELRLPSTKHVSQEEKTVRWLLTLVAPAVHRIQDPRNRQRVADAFGMELNKRTESERRITPLERQTIWDIQNKIRGGESWE